MHFERFAATGSSQCVAVVESIFRLVARFTLFSSCLTGGLTEAVDVCSAPSVESSGLLVSFMPSFCSAGGLAEAINFCSASSMVGMEDGKRFLVTTSEAQRFFVSQKTQQVIRRCALISESPDI